MVINNPTCVYTATCVRLCFRYMADRPAYSKFCSKWILTTALCNGGNVATYLLPSLKGSNTEPSKLIAYFHSFCPPLMYVSFINSFMFHTIKPVNIHKESLIDSNSCFKLLNCTIISIYILSELHALQMSLIISVRVCSLL